MDWKSQGSDVYIIQYKNRKKCKDIHSYTEAAIDGISSGVIKYFCITSVSSAEKERRKLSDLAVIGTVTVPVSGE